MSVLFFHTMKYRYDDPRNFNNDRFIMSKVRGRLRGSDATWRTEDNLAGCLSCRVTQLQLSIPCGWKPAS